MGIKKETGKLTALPGTDAEERSAASGAPAASDKDGRRHCRRCLLRETDREGYFKNLYAYIDGLEEEIRAAEPVYRDRLDRCRQCDLLWDGMCRACGCFVELRAAVGTNRCPYGNW